MSDLIYNFMTRFVLIIFDTLIYSFLLLNLIKYLKNYSINCLLKITKCIFDERLIPNSDTNIDASST